MGSDLVSNLCRWLGYGYSGKRLSSYRVWNTSNTTDPTSGTKLLTLPEQVRSTFSVAFLLLNINFLGSFFRSAFVFFSYFFWTLYCLLFFDWFMSSCYLFAIFRRFIFVSFGGTLFQQVVGIPMGTNCAPLLADLFFTHMSLGYKKIHEARAFNFTYRYIDDVLSIN